MADKKMIDLLDDIQQCGVSYEEYEKYGMRFQDTVSNEVVADHLISNGVTVRERGRWINPYMNRYGHPCHCCSVCGFKASYQDKNYCPNCGADMRGEEDGNTV